MEVYGIDITGLMEDVSYNRGNEIDILDTLLMLEEELPFEANPFEFREKALAYTKTDEYQKQVENYEGKFEGAGHKGIIALLIDYFGEFEIMNLDAGKDEEGCFVIGLPILPPWAYNDREKGLTAFCFESSLIKRIERLFGVEVFDKNFGRHTLHDSEKNQ